MEQRNIEKTAEYVHVVQYYETDKMGITHHSNYIRWMEEARVDYLDKAGWDYAKLEAMGVISAVVSLSCDYKRPTTFSDRITIQTMVTAFKGVTFEFSYEMRNQEGTVVFTGSSRHAFLNEAGRPVHIRSKYPELYEGFSKLPVSEPN